MLLSSDAAFPELAFAEGEVWPHPHGEKEPGTQSPAPESLPGPCFFHKAKRLEVPHFPG